MRNFNALKILVQFIQYKVKAELTFEDHAFSNIYISIHNIYSKSSSVGPRVEWSQLAVTKIAASSPTESRNRYARSSNRDELAEKMVKKNHCVIIVLLSRLGFI